MIGPAGNDLGEISEMKPNTNIQIDSDAHKEIRNELFWSSDDHPGIANPRDERRNENKENFYPEEFTRMESTKFPLNVTLKESFELEEGSKLRMAIDYTTPYWEGEAEERFT